MLRAFLGSWPLFPEIWFPSLRALLVVIRTFLTDFILKQLCGKGALSAPDCFSCKRTEENVQNSSAHNKKASLLRGWRRHSGAPCQGCIPVRADRKLILCPGEKQGPSKCTHLRIEEVEDQLVEERLWCGHRDCSSKDRWGSFLKQIRSFKATFYLFTAHPLTHSY